MASQEVLQAMAPVIYERDRQEFSLGDTLDIKTGLILAALTFLAIQSGELIHFGLPTIQKVIQYISIAALVIGGTFATLELWPSQYEREASPNKYLRWLEVESEKLKRNPEAVSALLSNSRLERTLERVSNNLLVNTKKSKFMMASFVCALASFAANVATLFIRLLS